MLDYARHHPRPADVPLVVEIAGSSLAHDRRTKARLYATAGIPTCWILNLLDNVVEVHTHPATVARRYDRLETVQPDGLLQLDCGAAGTLQVPVATFLPE